MFETRSRLDRAIGYIAPRYAVKRAHAAMILRAYDAAAYGRRRTGFGAAGTIGGSANSGIGLDLTTLRNRSRAMVRNTGHGASIVDKMQTSVCGIGIYPVWNTGSDRVDNAVGLLWEEWSQRADVEGQQNFGGLQSLAFRSVVEGGEMLWRFVDLPRSSGGKIPVRVQLLEGDHIDTSRDGVVDGRKVRLGVALADWNRRAGFYLFAEHPGERIAALTSKLVAADDVQHVYRALRIGQLRGVPWMAPVLMSAKDLADLYQFTIVKAQVEASFAGYITSAPGAAEPVLETTTDSKGARQMMPEPGSLYQLQPGQEITFPEPSQSTQFAAVALSILQAMAAGVGLTYDQVTGDLRQANYSSLRAGKIEHRRLVEVIQNHVVIPRICEPTADRFIDRAIFAGLLKSRTGGYPRTWVPPANEPIDPKKDLEADIEAVRAGRMPPQDFIAQWGYDWRKVVDDTATFWAAVEAAGKKHGVAIAFDIDGRKPRNAGTPPADDSAKTGAEDGADKTGETE